MGAAAVALAHAFLTGTGAEYFALQGPPCLTGPPASAQADEQMNAALQQQRLTEERYFHVDFATLKILGVRTRNVTKTSGEAEVLYNAPASKTGNYNWVGFKLYDGRWKVADCIAPIGGNGEDSAPTPIPSG